MPLDLALVLVEVAPVRLSAGAGTRGGRGSDCVVVAACGGVGLIPDCGCCQQVIVIVNMLHSAVSMERSVCTENQLTNPPWRLLLMLFSRLSSLLREGQELESRVEEELQTPPLMTVSRSAAAFPEDVFERPKRRDDDAFSIRIRWMFSWISASCTRLSSAVGRYRIETSAPNSWG